MIIIKSECDVAVFKEFCQTVWSRMSAVSISESTEVAPEEDDVSDDGTVNLGCGNSFKGGRCADGIDPSDCIYEDFSDKGFDKCSGIYHIDTIPDDASCKDQRGLFKCFKNEFKSTEECKATCPGKCLNLECKIPTGPVADERRRRRRR